MPTDYANAFNGIITVISFVILLGLLWLARLTRANGFYWKAAAFAWVVVMRALLYARVEPFVKYSAQVTFPFYVMFLVGLVLTIRKLLLVYKTNGNVRSAAAIITEQQRIDEAEEAAKNLKTVAADVARTLKVDGENERRGSHD